MEFKKKIAFISVIFRVIIVRLPKQKLRDYIRSSLYTLHRVHLRHKCLRPVSADLVLEQVAVIKFQGTISRVCKYIRHATSKLSKVVSPPIISYINRSIALEKMRTRIGFLHLHARARRVYQLFDLQTRRPRLVSIFSDYARGLCASVAVMHMQVDNSIYECLTVSVDEERHARVIICLDLIGTHER